MTERPIIFSGPMVRIQNKVSHYMDDILDSFRPGAKIAVLVRIPGEPTMDFMITNDDPAEVLVMIARRLKEDANG